MPKRLLVVDPIPTHRIRLRAALRAAQYDIVSVDRVACAASANSVLPVDMVLLNTSGADPSRMLVRLRKAMGGSNAPILCRDEDANPRRRLQALAAGARDMLSSNVPATLLLARLRGLLRESDTASELERRRVTATSFGFAEAATPFGHEGCVVCVDASDSPSPLAPLPPDAFGRQASMSCDALLRDDSGDAKPDAIIMTVAPGAGAMLDALLPEFRTRSHLRHASVLVVHSPDEPDVAVRALNLGAADVAEADALDEEMTFRIDAMLRRKRARDALRRTSEESYRLATTDTLTGLYNRRYAEVYLADVLIRSRESGRGFTAMMVDIDHFKAVNDVYGHASGDRVLAEVAARIRDNLRAVDLVSRHGGEEFLVILPDIDGAEAEMAADRIRAIINGKPIRLEDGKSLEVSVSIGVAVASPPVAVRPESAHIFGTGCSDESGISPLIRDLLAKADRALYSAKDSGRNCVSISPETASAA